MVVDDLGHDEPQELLGERRIEPRLLGEGAEPFDQRKHSRERGLLDASAVGDSEHGHGRSGDLIELTRDAIGGTPRHRLVDGDR